MQLEERFGVELLRVESVRLLPDLPQLSHAALNTAQETCQGASRQSPPATGAALRRLGL